MNAQLITQARPEEISPLRLIKSDLKILNIQYNRALNFISAVGWSTNQDTWVKYLQILADIESHLLHRDELNIYFKINMLNTSSTKYIFKIIKKLNQAHSQGKKIKLFWSCNTEHENEMIETGLDLRGLSNFSFEINYAGKKY